MSTRVAERTMAVVLGVCRVVRAWILAAVRRMTQSNVGADRNQAPVTEWTERAWDGDVQVYDHAGTRVEYLDYGSGAPIVLLHGMGCCWQWWLECIPALARQRRVIAIDTPGFGGSGTLPGPVSMSDYAAVIAGVVRYAGLGPATVVGHSMGGLIAIEVADRYPELVTDLVLVDSGGVPMSDRRLEIVLAALRVAQQAFASPRFLELLVRSRRARRLLLRGLARDPGVMSDQLAAVVIPKLNAPGFPDAITSSAAAVRDSTPERITHPTVLIWGEKDPFAPLRTAEDMLARLPHGRLEVLPGLGHTPLIEAPETLSRLLLHTGEAIGPVAPGDPASSSTVFPDTDPLNQGACQ